MSLLTTRPTAEKASSPTEFDKATIADLSFAQMRQLTHNDLIAVTRGAELPLPALQHRNLQFMNREELERIAYLARRSCRQQGY